MLYFICVLHLSSCYVSSRCVSSSYLCIAFVKLLRFFRMRFFQLFVYCICQVVAFLPDAFLLVVLVLATAAALGKKSG